MSDPSDLEMRERVFAHLSTRQRETVDRLRLDFGVDLWDWSSSGRVLLEDAALLRLYEEFEAMGYTGHFCAVMAGDEIGLSPSNARTRFYRRLKASIEDVDDA